MYIHNELTARPFRPDDLASLGWLAADRLLALTETVEQTRLGDVELWALCDQADVPVAFGGVDFVRRPGRGYLWLLTTVPQLRSMGLATRLIGLLEARMLDRDVAVANAAVRVADTSVRRLYEHLGYSEYGLSRLVMPVTSTNSVVRHTHLVELHKHLTVPVVTP